MGQSDFGLMSEISNSHEIDEELIANYLKKYKVLDSVKNKDQTIHFLFNYNTLKLEYLSENVYDVTGKEMGYFSGVGEEFLKKVFREKDIPIIVREIPRSFQEIRNRYSQDEIENLSFQIFTRLSKNLCGGRNKLFQYKVIECDEFKKPLLCFGWITEVSFATIPQYISIAVNHIDSGKNQIVFQQKYNYNDEQLSNREIQVVRLLVEGMTSQEVADHLNISVKTVNNHRQNILRKLGAKSTSEVIRYAVLHGHF